MRVPKALLAGPLIWVAINTALIAASPKVTITEFDVPTPDSRPHDPAVAPDGSLFLSIGGRKTRGAVYRIDYPAGRTLNLYPTNWFINAPSEVEGVLTAPQPLDAWSRAAWVPTAVRLGPEPFIEAAMDGREQSLFEALVLRGLEIGIDVVDAERLLGERRRVGRIRLCRPALFTGHRRYCYGSLFNRKKRFASFSIQQENKSLFGYLGYCINGSAILFYRY